MKFYYLSDSIRDQQVSLINWFFKNFNTSTIHYFGLILDSISTEFMQTNRNKLNYRLMDFFPPKKQTEEYLRAVFVEKELSEVVKLHKAQTSNEAKRELTQVQLCFWFIPLLRTLGLSFIR